MIVQDDRGSLLTKGSLYNHFYRADARHEISCRKARIFVSQSVLSGINIKRSPLCGRNFEYYSEDPFLAGELAVSYIRSMQKCGVGTSLKHFAGNNQETHRMTSNSMIDERALHEIYLASFEQAV